MQIFYTDMFHDFQYYSDDLIKENPLLYEFNEVTEKHSEYDLFYSKTVIYPMTIGNEFNMTRGHIHTNQTSEIYYVISGSGYVLEKVNDVEKLIKISTGSVVYINGDTAHRVINDSNEQLIFLSVGRSDTKHDYNVGFKTRVMKSN